MPIEIVSALGGRERRLVASVLGADRIERGLALHESAAALARFVELAGRDRPEELAAMAFTSLTIDAGPAWVADAVKAAYGDPIVVVPVASGPGGARAVTPEELTMLAAAMFAVSKLAPGRLTSAARLPALPMVRTSRVPTRRALTAHSSVLRSDVEHGTVTHGSPSSCFAADRHRKGGEWKSRDTG